MILLNNWSVVVKGGLYDAPELQTYHLKGEVTGHPLLPDGEHVMTSYIVCCRDRIVTTNSGNSYRLGKISTAYRKALKAIKPDWNWRKPFG